MSTAKRREKPYEPEGGTSFDVSFAGGDSFDLNEVRRRRESFMPDGEHAWVICTVFGIDDPDASLDSMELGAENFVGVTALHCLLCTVAYAPSIRHHKCPQVPTQ